jgi:hypothetical protein
MHLKDVGIFLFVPFEERYWGPFKC